MQLTLTYTDSEDVSKAVYAQCMSCLSFIENDMTDKQKESSKMIMDIIYEQVNKTILIMCSKAKPEYYLSFNIEAYISDLLELYLKINKESDKHGITNQTQE